MRLLAFTCCVLLIQSAFGQVPEKFVAADQPAAPDYSKEENWSALPFRHDAADKIPNSETWVEDSVKQVDVFYIYPTMHMKGKTYNADVTDKKLNRRIDTKPVQYQASVFNASCRVYAPRYRQSIIDVFKDKKEEGAKSLAFAYDDVKRAFDYYLKNYNNGRPFIIASHSQGTYHSRRLLKEVIDNNPVLQKQMVAAYTIGYAMYDTAYTVLQPCHNATETGCYITWASYKSGFEPEADDVLVGKVCVNPVTWTRDTTVVSADRSMGTMLLNFNKKYEHACGTQIHNNILWVENTLPLVRSANVLHIADYNLFWYDIRQNVADRIKAYFKN